MKVQRKGSQGHGQRHSGARSRNRIGELLELVLTEQTYDSPFLCKVLTFFRKGKKKRTACNLFC